MAGFDRWWHSIYADKPRHIYRQCWEEGYDQGFAEGVASVQLTKFILLAAVAVCAVFGVVVLS